MHLQLCTMIRIRATQTINGWLPDAKNWQKSLVQDDSELRALRLSQGSGATIRVEKERPKSFTEEGREKDAENHIYFFC
jgi:hypothetical protein